MVAKAQKGLGRGLSALIAEAQETAATAPANDVSQPSSKLALKVLRPGQFQPRRVFDEAELAELAGSIRHSGVIQPVVVRAVGDYNPDYPDARYELIAGERRWRASKLAGLVEIPAIVMELTDSEALEVALVENIQRQDLLPLEVAEAYQKLGDEFGYTQQDLSDIVGKSRSQVTNFMRLLALPPRVKAWLNEGKLSVGHARALLMESNPDQLAEEVVKRGLSVRQTEARAQQASDPRLAQKRSAERVKPAKGSREARLEAFGLAYKALAKAEQDPDILELQEMLSKNLGTELTIIDEQDKGKIVVHYESVAELDLVLRKLEQLAAVDA